MLKIITVVVLIIGLVVMLFDFPRGLVVKEPELVMTIDKDSAVVAKANQSGRGKPVTSTEHWMMTVEMWSKAAIGQYVWESVLRGAIDEQGTVEATGMHYIEGSTTIENVRLIFRSGASLKVATLLASSVPNLILVLNWRNQHKINYSLPWLEAVRRNEQIANAGIIALGSERCANDWFLPYLNEVGSKIRFLFVVYDWNQVDDRIIYQWPLGTATYRNFPPGDLSSATVQSTRPYLCNFIATVYPNSSRQELKSFFEGRPELSSQCLVKVRDQWQPQENEHSLSFYVKALRQSDLTLSPVGLNHECYRILEAVEYGSVPVVEISPQQVASSCDSGESSPLRLFHQLNAPFIYVSNWTEQLPLILRSEGEMSAEEKVRRRVRLLKWYYKFKSILRSRLISVVRQNFIVT